MGGEPWFHVAPYQSDVPAALEALRQRVFAEGEYRGSEAEPATIEEALPNMDADGTASILDIDHVADQPEPPHVTPLPPAEAKKYFGTERPTRADVEQADEFWDDIGRGEAVCVVLLE